MDYLVYKAIVETLEAVNLKVMISENNVKIINQIAGFWIQLRHRNR